MRIWVLGCEGMLGRAFVKNLKSQVDLILTSHKDVDITQESSVLRFAERHHPDLWINCSGYTKVDMAEDNKSLAFAVNSEGPFILSQCAAKLAPTYERAPCLVHFSTDYVFDGKQQVPYKETDTPHPLSIYGRSKLEGEQKLQAAYENHLIFRLSWLFGYEGHNFVKTMLDLMKKHELLRVVDDQIGCPTFCDDVVEAVWKMQSERGLFHLCNEEEVSWHGFAQEIAHQARMLHCDLRVQLIEPISSDELKRPATRPSYSVLDTSKLASKGITLRPWTQALQEYLKVSLSI